MGVTEQPTAATPTAAEEIVAQLGETEQEPIRQLRRAVRILGEERIRDLVARALKVEASGGTMIPDGSRRRTVGGVFFHLARAELGQKEFYRVFRPQGQGGGPPGQKTMTAMSRTVRTGSDAAGEPFDEATFGAAAAEAMSEAGEATTVKLTVIGRPGTVVERGDVVLVGMRSEKAPSLPKGVPVPTSPRTDYMVLVGMKQWSKVAEALAVDPADKVIVEGYPTVRPEFAGITVYATSGHDDGHPGRQARRPSDLASGAVGVALQGRIRAADRESRTTGCEEGECASCLVTRSLSRTA